ncbi:hypothetical protein BV25DRAFT_327633 [Artomyces pyxidatus]|uniref:Uncharacterized protein n=1 Tax=Artomyces pyxidatus TaxID=48021 RepID=A0ACB8T773_9AGAM|nr:hypothetical protein BV25DRAFT_327633 [Artomyces pyxidatus]
MRLPHLGKAEEQLLWSTKPEVSARLRPWLRSSTQWTRDSLEVESPSIAIIHERWQSLFRKWQTRGRSLATSSITLCIWKAQTSGQLVRLPEGLTYLVSG